MIDGNVCAFLLAISLLGPFPFSPVRAFNYMFPSTASLLLIVCFSRWARSGISPALLVKSKRHAYTVAGPLPRLHVAKSSILPVSAVGGRVLLAPRDAHRRQVVIPFLCSRSPSPPAASIKATCRLH
ncbi:hypothetical protein B0H63DRAFT_191190 [Podospora didyma]|uniref:Secreted protein n=1 Tax=Podospora didyma TaxID=330526 RepID=A0AAE0NRB3_9PEZI|nr:hypothetical protein B0H63DRAFT_191190 [Podospora didyma]